MLKEFWLLKGNERVCGNQVDSVRIYCMCRVKKAVIGLFDDGSPISSVKLRLWWGKLHC